MRWQLEAIISWQAHHYGNVLEFAIPDLQHIGVGYLVVSSERTRLLRDADNYGIAGQSIKVCCPYNHKILEHPKETCTNLQEEGIRTAS